MMQIEIVWNPDTPHSMALNIISEMAELVRLFGAGAVNIEYDEGELERLMATERNRILRIG